jgi:pentatricopeptide repeat protein
MIAKNEAERLPECLSSAGPIIDEIVVVDTGSTDNTVEVAQRFDAKTFSYEWCDDFSAARNESLRHATGDWVIVLDADEIIAPEDLPRIREFVDGDEFDAVQFVLANYTDECQSMWWKSVDESSVRARGYSGYIRVPLVRMWRNRAEHRFRGCVHETVVESIRAAGGRIAETDIVIHHYGKNSRAPEKSRFYLNLGMRNVSERPNDSKAHYDLAVQLKELGRLDEAESHYREALSLDPDSSLARSGLVEVLARGGRLAEAERILEKMEADGAVPGASVNLAIIRMRRGDLESAMERLSAAVAGNPADVVAHIYLGKVHERCADMTSAEEAYRRAAEACPAFAPAQAALNAFRKRKEARGLLHAGDAPGALRSFKDAVNEEPADAMAYAELAPVLMSLGQGEAAYRMLLRALESEPHLAVARRKLREVAEFLDKTAEAEQVLVALESSYVMERGGL